MRNYAKFSFVMVVAMLSGCRSHKAVEESAYVAADSCKVETSLNLQSMTNIATAESEDSSIRQDHFDFVEGAGIIQIHPDGEVTIKGLKSAAFTRNSIHKTDELQLSESDSLSAESNSESNSSITSEAKTKSETPIPNSRWYKLLFLVGAIFLVFCIKYAVHYVKKSQ